MVRLDCQIFAPKHYFMSKIIVLLDLRIQKLAQRLPHYKFGLHGKEEEKGTRFF